MKLLTEAEAAQLLSRPVSAIRRLRRNGQLRYLPGRPVMVDEADLAAYTAAAKAAAEQPTEATLPTKRELTQNEQAAAMARQIWLQRKLRTKSC